MDGTHKKIDAGPYLWLLDRYNELQETDPDRVFGLLIYTLNSEQSSRVLIINLLANSHSNQLADALNRMFYRDPKSFKSTLESLKGIVASREINSIGISIYKMLTQFNTAVLTQPEDQYLIEDIRNLIAEIEHNCVLPHDYSVNTKEA